MADTNSTRSFANRSVRLHCAMGIVGSWIRDNPFECIAGSIVFCLEVALILTLLGIIRGLHSDASFIRVQFTWFTTKLLLFTSALGFLFLAIERYFNVIGKTQEYGLLRVLGASSGDFFFILLCDTFVIAVPGSLAGIVFTFWIRLGVNVIFSKYLHMDILVFCWPIALCIATTGSMLGGMLGARTAIRNGIVQALSYEN